MDEKEVRACISAVAKELGLKIKSMSCHPLTKTWYIDIGDTLQVSFKPSPDATVKECTREFKERLGLREERAIVIEEEIEQLRRRSPDDIFAAMTRLQKVGEPAVEPLIQVLLDPTQPSIFRIRVADTLAGIHSPKAVEPLIELLKNADVQIRSSAAVALGQIGDERAIAPLERLAATDTGRYSIMPDLHVSVREDAQRALYQIKPSHDWGSSGPTTDDTQPRKSTVFSRLLRRLLQWAYSE